MNAPCRSQDAGATGRSTQPLAAERLAARFVWLDVTDEDSVAAAAKTIEAGGGLDVVVNVSSGLSKAADLADPGWYAHFYPGVAYTASKAAVNMLTLQYAKALPGIKVNAVDPGYTATDLNGGTGTQTVEQGAAVLVTMAQTGLDGPTGQFFDSNGSIAW